jgi:hypothetical protein
MLGNDGMPAEQPATLTASEAARHTRQKWRSFPRLRIGPNFEPPSVKALLRRRAQRLRLAHDERQHHIGALT